MLLLDGVGHDDQEKVKIFCLFWFFHLLTVWVLATDVLQIVVINSFFKRFNARFVAQLYNVSIINIDFKSSFLRKLIKPIVKIFSMVNIFLETENGPLSEVDGLMDNSSKNLSIIKWSSRQSLSWILLIETAAWLEYLWPLKYISSNSIRLKINIQIPFFNFLGI